MSINPTVNQSSVNRRPQALPLVVCFGSALAALGKGGGGLQTEAPGPGATCWVCAGLIPGVSDCDALTDGTRPGQTKLCVLSADGGQWGLCND